MKYCENCLYYKDCDVQEFVNADICEHYKRKFLINLFRLFYREPKTYIYEYGGYILEQTSYNWHYMIFEKHTRKMVLHASCTKKLTKKQATRILTDLWEVKLVPRQIIFDIAKVREYGLKKYGEKESWKKVEIERYRDATFRHFMAYLDNPQGLDEESGLPHLWHLANNVAFLCELEAKNKQTSITGVCFVI